MLLPGVAGTLNKASGQVPVPGEATVARWGQAGSTGL
jgi:hypothetical protein